MQSNTVEKPEDTDLARTEVVSAAPSLPDERGSWPLRAERGAIMAEYAFLIALIALVAAASVTLVGTRVQGLYTAAIGVFPAG